VAAGDRPSGKGLLIVIVGPSGVGKGTLAAEALKRLGPRARSSVSATTRERRAGEMDGINYFFMSRADFERDSAAGRFIEHAEFDGHLYGTPRKFLEENLARGVDVVMDIDVQGAAQIMKVIPDGVFVFILPPSREALAERLRRRGRDDDATIARRLAIADRELARQDLFPNRVVNDRVDRAAEEIMGVIDRARKARDGRA
jgi:guanylate kinase